MEKKKILWRTPLVMMLLLLGITPALLAQQDIPLSTIFYSTEEDFSAGPDIAPGNVISDGDLLIAPGTVYMRNADLLQFFPGDEDLGLDAADVILESDRLVVFSTELDHPRDIFASGDLLSTVGMVIPNAALLSRFGLPRELDLGLDAVQMIGKPERIIEFVLMASGLPYEEWLHNPNLLLDLLRDMDVDIWFSTEGTPFPYENPAFLDGDLLSARNGVIVLRNFDALPNPVPAGLPYRGVDFGMDGATNLTPENFEDTTYVYFSTEILYERNPAFTDGDVMLKGFGSIYDNYPLISGFFPAADFLGLDALSIEWTDFVPGVTPVIE